MARFLAGRHGIPAPSQVVNRGRHPEPRTALRAQVLRRVCRHARTARRRCAAEDTRVELIHSAQGATGAAATRVLRHPDRRLVDAGRAFLRTHSPAHLGVLAPRTTQRPSPHATHGISSPAEQTGAFGIRTYLGPDVGRRRSHNFGGSGRKEVAKLLSEITPARDSAAGGSDEDSLALTFIPLGGLGAATPRRRTFSTERTEC